VRSTAGTNRDAMRPHNLGVVLRHVHRDGALSRAALTARMGLTRGSVGGLLTELESMNTVIIAPDPTRRSSGGRPSPRVTPDTVNVQVLGAEIGAEHIRVVSVGLGGRILATAARATPRTHAPGDVADALVGLARDVSVQVPKGAAVLGLGIGVAGLVGVDGHIEMASSLGWANLPFADLVQARVPTDLVIKTANDADLGALAEHVRGAGLGVDDLVYVGVDDPGVGGGIIAEGRALRGARGYAGEFGHMLVNPDGIPCRCGNVGCWETEIGTARIAEALEIDTRDTDAVAAALGRVEHVPSKLRTAGRYLGAGLAGIVNALNPEMVVLGGTLRDLYPVVQIDAGAAFERLVLPGPRAFVRIALSRLGPDAASVGAAEMVFESLFDDPVAVLTAAHRGPVRGRATGWEDEQVREPATAALG
jgi:predicted NBD/HSP70 family sugar kinase